MKRFKWVAGSAVFLAIGLVLTVSVCYVLRPTTNDFFRKRFAGFYAEENDSLDIVACGSSALYRYLCTPMLYETTGLTSYPLATPGQSVFLTKYLVDEILKTQSPQLLVVECRKYLLKDKKTAMESRLRIVTDNMDYSLNRFLAINELVSGWGRRLSYYFDIMLYHDNWENLNMDSLTYWQNRKENSLKGWANNGRHKALEKPDLTNVTEETPLSEVSEEALIELMEKCREKNLEVLFVLSPFRISPEMQRKSNYMRRLVEEQGFRFLDGNLCVDEMGLDYSMDFYNPKHTNSIGAGKFTNYLGEYILENYDIDIDHSPEVTASWDRAVEENRIYYEAACKEVLTRAQQQPASE